MIMIMSSTKVITLIVSNNCNDKNDHTKEGNIHKSDSSTNNSNNNQNNNDNVDTNNNDKTIAVNILTMMT